VLTGMHNSRQTGKRSSLIRTAAEAIKSGFA
jgi:hypothetical protein